MFIDKCKLINLPGTDGNEIILELRVNPRAKRLILRIDAKKQCAVAIAPSVHQLDAALEFAKTRISWIEQQLHKAHAPIALTDGAEFPLRGLTCCLTCNGEGHLPVLEQGSPLMLRLPGDIDTLPARALRYLKHLATEDLSRAVRQHAVRLGVSPKRITVRDTRSRWGSCSHAGHLSFSWRLILAPEHILSYVAAHEVAHLLEMNHGSAFWAHVERTYPDWRPARDWLRHHGQTLHSVSA